MALSSLLRHSSFSGSVGYGKKATEKATRELQGKGRAKCQSPSAAYGNNGRAKRAPLASGACI